MSTSAPGGDTGPSGDHAPGRQSDSTSAARYVALRKTLDGLAVTKVSFKVATERVTRVQVRLVSSTQGQRNAHSIASSLDFTWIIQ